MPPEQLYGTHRQISCRTLLQSYFVCSKPPRNNSQALLSLVHLLPQHQVKTVNNPSFPSRNPSFKSLIRQQHHYQPPSNHQQAPAISAEGNDTFATLLRYQPIVYNIPERAKVVQLVCGPGEGLSSGEHFRRKIQAIETRTCFVQSAGSSAPWSA